MMRSVRVLVLVVAVATAGLISSPASAATRAKPFDIDGDGKRELVVGAPGEDVKGRRAAGQVHIVYTNRRGLTHRDELLHATNPAQRAFYGAALTSGDFDRDGFADLAVGAWREADEEGRVHLAYGSAGGVNRNRTPAPLIGTTNKPTEITGPGENRFGASLAVGDFNSDGFDDLAAGAPNGNGAVYVWYGGRRGIRGPSQEWSADVDGMNGELFGSEADMFGSALAPGDIDGDGHDDLVIGAMRSGSAEGAMFVMYGSGTGLTIEGSQKVTQDTPGIKDHSESREVSTGEDVGDRFGASLAVGDFDSDGRDDVAVGAPAESYAENAATDGALHVIYGTRSGLGRRDQLFTQFDKGLELPRRHVASMFGMAVAAGDLDGDGDDDLAIGGPRGSSEDHNFRGTGFVVVVRGSGKGLTRVGDGFLSQDTPGVAGHGEADVYSGDYFGESLAVRNLGRGRAADLIVGTPGEDLGSAKEAGAVHVFWGGKDAVNGKRSRLWSEDWTGMKDEAERSDGSARVSGTWRLLGYDARDRPRPPPE